MHAISYSDTKTTYIRLNDGKITESKALDNNVCVDFDFNGNVVGVEIFDVLTLSDVALY